MTEFVIRLDHRPGALARLTEVLAAAGINVESLAAWGADGHGIVRLIVDDDTAARRAMAAAGLRVTEHTVLTTTIDHKPGALATLARRLADAEINVEAVYVLHAGEWTVDLAIVVDEPDAARPLLPIRG